jgi:hypothetical protein
MQRQEATDLALLSGVFQVTGIYDIPGNETNPSSESVSLRCSDGGVYKLLSPMSFKKMQGLDDKGQPKWFELDLTVIGVEQMGAVDANSGRPSKKISLRLLRVNKDPVQRKLSFT